MANRKRKEKRTSSKVGKRYGLLTVLKVDETVQDELCLICKCDCGNIISVNARNLRNTGGQKSCGCTRGKHKQKDVTGQKFGELIAIEPDFDISKKSKNVVWKCLCYCGNFVNVPLNNLQSGHTTSCGCKKEKAQKDIKSRVVGIKKSLNTGRYETNIHAKEWTLISPNGDIYHIKNLSLFIRENYRIFGLQNNDVEIKKQMKRMSYAAHHNNKCDGWICICKD